MANERKIIVEIVTNFKGAEAKDQDGSNDDARQKNNANSKEQAVKAMVMMALGKVTDTVTNAVSLSMNRYFSMSENYMAETDYQNAMSFINKGKSFIGTVGASAMGGTALGPGGMAIGAVIGAAAWVGNEFVSYQQKMSNYYQNLNATNFQTEFDRTRMGLSNEGKGTEN